MATLIFYGDTHTYVADGHIVPSVSEIFAPVEDFSNVNPEALRRAAIRGTLVHEYAELLDYGEPLETFEVETELVHYVEAYARFLKDYKPEWTAVEKAMYSPDLNFAGTIDRFGIIDGKETLVDIKTASTVSQRTKIIWAAKLHAYSLLLNRPVDRWNLLLLPDGKYRIYKANETEAKSGVDSAELFATLLRLNHILEV